jgi:hypothetical protein
MVERLPFNEVSGVSSLLCALLAVKASTLTANWNCSVVRTLPDFPTELALAILPYCPNH